MSTITPEQHAEAVVNDFFGNSLTTEQHTLAVQISKEIFFEAKSKALALEQWRERVSQFEQDFQTRLSQADTPQQLSALRLASLRLQDVTGEAARDIFNEPLEERTHYERGVEYAKAFLAQGETETNVRVIALKLCKETAVTLKNAPFNNAKMAFAYSQRGIDHAETFLTQGETNVAERVFMLYDIHLSLYFYTDQIGQLLSLLPMKGLWSWIALNQVAPNNWQIVLRNWQIYLGISHNPAHFTAAFQSLLRTIVLNWHCPLRPHRHFGFIPTQTLLAISEGLYSLEQATDNQKLQTVYRSLVKIANSTFVQESLILKNEQQRLQRAINQLDKRTWLYSLRRWWLKHKLQNNQQSIQQQNELSQTDWHKTVKAANDTIVEWLTAGILKQLVFPTSDLQGLPEIALGMLLASHCSQTQQAPETLLAEWQQSPPWQTAATLRTTLAPSQWQQWGTNPHNPKLSLWIYALKHDNDTVRRLKPAWEVINQSQPNLQAWLKELATDNHQTLSQQLELAWNTAQTAAQKLAPIFIALSNPNFRGDLFAKRDSKDTDYRRALGAVILGDVADQIEQALSNWLNQQIPPATARTEIEILNTFNTLKYRFTRGTTLYHNPRYAKLETAVHEWSKLLLQETLQTEPTVSPFYAFQPVEPQPDYTTIWRILEQTRVGLNSLTLHLPKDWADTLGEQLWQSLAISIKSLAEGHKPTEQEMWPPLATWLQTLDKWLSKPPPIEQCQQSLSPTEALVQPFFDPVHQRLRVLWLDTDGLRLQEELPDDCAPQHLWATETPTGIISQWISEIEVLKKTAQDSKVTETPDLETVLKSNPVISFATVLQQWATNQQLTQLTVIFPAPLGQLPWETLPQLENILVREISIGHWYEHRTAPQNTPTEPKPPAWVISDPSGAAQCMVKEAQWVTKHFEGKPKNCAEPDQNAGRGLQPRPQRSDPSVFDALHNLANCHQAHLATHGTYNRYDPNASFLTLASEQDIHFPLWMTAAIRTETNVVLLSACESNLSGQDTEGLLTPVGIGPTLAAAGAKTVVGTLWPCDGLAALCFSYYFYTIAQKNPQKPWHHVAAEARHAVRDMRRQELEMVIAEFDLADENDLCWKKSVERHKAVSLFQPPFNRFDLWAGFTVLGQVERLN
jgi:CHAT domain-containing protein